MIRKVRLIPAYSGGAGRRRHEADGTWSIPSRVDGGTASSAPPLFFPRGIGRRPRPAGRSDSPFRPSREDRGRQGSFLRPREDEPLALRMLFDRSEYDMFGKVRRPAAEGRSDCLPREDGTFRKVPSRPGYAALARAVPSRQNEDCGRWCIASWVRSCPGALAEMSCHRSSGT